MPAHRTHGYSVPHPGSEYTAEQVEFLRAVDRFRAARQRRPDCREVLAIARSLGYRKAERKETP